MSYGVQTLSLWISAGVALIVGEWEDVERYRVKKIVDRDGTRVP